MVDRVKAMGAAILLLTWLTGPLQAQERQIGDTPRCADCRIELVHVASLGHEADPTSPWEMVSVAIDSRGRIFMAPVAERTAVGVYDTSGRFVTTLGRAGSGPGEFRFAQEVHVLPGDTIVVGDPIQGRYSVFLPDLRHHSTVSLNVPVNGMVPFSSELVVAHAVVRSPRLAGLPLHVLRSGQTLVSFGADGALLPGATPATLGRSIAHATSGHIWSARVDRYEIELWDTAGQRLARLAGSRAWFSPWEQPSGDPALHRPATILQSVREDDKGLLWNLFEVASPGWMPNRPPPGGVLDARAYQIKRADEVDSLIEVIDPETGALIARQRFANLLFAELMGRNLLFVSQTQDELGNLTVHVWRAKLHGYDEDQQGKTSR